MKNYDQVVDRYFFAFTEFKKYRKQSSRIYNNSNINYSTNYISFQFSIPSSKPKRPFLLVAAIRYIIIFLLLKTDPPKNPRRNN